jgi:CHAT domain-containing protein
MHATVCLTWCLLASASSLQQEESTAPGCAVAASGETGFAGDIERFLGLLGSLRGGDESAASGLMMLAEHLSREHARPDCLDVARYYTALGGEDRARGLADEEEFFALRREVQRASEEASSGRPWSEASEEILADLVALGERVRGKKDFAPAARAFALASRLEVELAENGGSSRSGLLQSAGAHAEQAVELFARSGQITPQLEPLWVMGRIERARGNGAEARALFERCAELARSVQQADFEQNALFGLVALARDSGDVHAIDRLLARAAEITTPDESWPLAREHAVRLLHSEQAQAAEDFLTRHPPADPGWRDEWHALRGAANLRRGDLAEARNELAAMEESPSSELARLSCASIDLASGDPQAVLDALGVSGAMDDFSSLGQAQGASLLGEACLAGGEPDAAVPWLETALERASQWSVLQEEESPGSVFGEWIGLHTVVLLADAHARAGDALAAACVIESAQSRGLRAGGPSAAEREIEPAELLAWASRYELGLTTWCVGADRSIAVHVTRDGAATATFLARGRRTVEEGVRRLREAAASGDLERVHALGTELSADLLPADLAAALVSSQQGSRALFLLHGPLERLPLALLWLGNERLDARCAALVLPGLPPSGSSGSFDIRSSGEWLLLGAPAADESLVLPGAARELDLLARAHPRARLLTGSSFTHAALADALRSGAPLHIATHLVPSERCDPVHLAPLALLLAGGEHFCAAEIRELEPRSPLVVLSTCESAAGRFVDAEGLQGLARAFLEAGTRNLLVTLWPIEDTTAARAAELFHAELDRGSSPSLAARAMTARLEQEGYSVADWAAYRMLGRD